MYPVLLHPDLYGLLRQTAPSGRARVWKTLARLRSGQWGGGTRVKRLRGIGRPVYEARTDSGDRLLFTVARSAVAGQPDRLVSHLQVWDWVEHDDAVRVARRNRAAEAEFLELEAVEQFEIAEPPPFPGAAFDDIPAETGGAEGEADPLLRFLLPPDGAEPPLAEDLGGGIRWFQLAPAALASEADFQRLLDLGGDELELKLTREQYGILGLDGPVLLAGSAGSGKTTIAVHRLAEAAGRALYLSYSAPLVEHARRLYRDLLLSRGADPAVNPPDFFTFGDLYRSLVPRDFREHQARPMTEPLFREWFRKAGRSLDPALVWEELRSILKGACLSPSQAMLDEAAYQELGRKRAPLFVDERPEIYRIAQRYQEWLAEEGRSDRIDLCRRALKELRKGKPRAYDTVVCDEVQDLTELEVSFVLSLSAREDLSGVLLAGDTQQIVNPSGFRWAEVRRLAGKIGRRKTGPLTPEVRRLRRNLRSARPLVELANALLLLRREVFGRTEGDEPEEAAIEGPVPLQVTGDEDAVLAALEGFGPRAAVLTLDDAEAERLRARLGTTRVFHVREAKGLEFDAVVLWKLLDPDRDLVERFLRGDSRLGREPRFEHLLRHLYVGATRARRHLALYENRREGEREHPFWSLPRFRGRIEPETLESLSHLFRPTASPADWAREGDWFFERGRYRQAAECYRRGGLPERETEALACAEEALEDWTGALEHWQRLGLPARQAPLLERLGRLADAARLYREAGEAEAALLCELRQLEQRNAWREAAAGWEERGRHADAARCWERAGEEPRARLAGARAAEAAGDWAGAAAAWATLDDHAAAARCHEAAGDRRRATLARGRLYESARRWARAAAAYRLGGEPEAAERCRARALEEGGRLEEAARAWERLGELERAVELYDRAERWLDVARLEGSAVLRESGRSVRKIRELVESGAWEQAGPLAELRLEMLRPRIEPDLPWFIAPEEARQAWQEFRLLNDFENRCRALRAEAQGAWSRAARCWQKSGDHDRAVAAWERRREPIREPQAERSPAAGRPVPVRLGAGPVKPAEAGHPRHRHSEPAAFRVFLQGRSEGDAARQIVRHLLAGCPDCGRRLNAARDAALSGKALNYDTVFDRLERRVTGTLERRQIEEKSAPELYEELFRHEAIEGLIQVHSTRRYASIALCELLLQKSRELCAAAPGEAHTAARLAVAVAEQLDLDLYGSPVVQDLRALTWAYVGDVQRVMADLRSARSCLDLAGRLIEEGTGDPLLEAELLSLEASFLCQSGDFEPAVRLLNRAASIYRRSGDRHLVGRVMVKKGTVLGNAGEAETAARLIRRGIDHIDLLREPRLMVYAVHNLIWFLHDTGHRDQARACIEGTRSLYRQGRDRRQLGRLRWLEGKLASADPGFVPDKAEGALAEAQETLIKEGLSYEAALAAVDLACLYAGEGRGAEMRRQASQILPLFQAGEMYQETVTALTTFQKCQHDVNPATLLKELGGYIHRVRDEKNPKWLSSALLKGGPKDSSRPPLAL